MFNLKESAKAYVAGAVAGLSAAVPLTVNDGVSLNDALIIALAAVVGFQTTYWVNNTNSENRPGGDSQDTLPGL